MPPTTTPKRRFDANMLGSKQKEQLASTGAFTASTGEVRNAQGAAIQPTVSADTLANPPAPVTPPVPTVNTNDGSRTNNLIGNVATNTQGFITAQSEEATKAKELANLLGTQTYDAAGQRADLTKEYGVTDNLSRLTDIQTQLAQRNTESAVTQSRIQNAAGQTLGQSGREVTQDQREAAIRDAGLAAEASVLQGNIETASTLINNAMTDFYSDRTAKNANMVQQLEYFSGITEGQTKQLIDAETRKYTEDQAAITRAQTLVDDGVSSGYIAGKDLQTVLGTKDPTAQAELAQTFIAKGIQREIADAKAKAASGGFSTPDVKNFGTTDAPIWKQWNATTGAWQDVSGVEGTQAVEEVQQSLDQLSFLRDTTARILGGKSADGLETYDPLYEAAGPSGVAKFFGDTFVGDTDYRRLETYADTLRTNVLALMTDPSVKKFFGPQMSNADVKLMSATGSSLRPESNAPADIKVETQRLDDLLNRMQTAVKNGQSGTPIQGPVQQTATNVITAPDGLQIEITD